MRQTCRLFHILATCTVLISSATAFAQNLNSTTPKTTPKATLIVWARTDIPNQGAPTLDILDLERYFVKDLMNRRIENVMPSATAKLPNPPEPETFLLELSVDALQTATRAKPDEFKKGLEPDPVFSVELSLVVKHLASGKVLGGTGERYEIHLRYVWELETLEPKRAAIYKAADRLAERFIDAADEGKFGEQLRSVRQPFWAPLELWHLVAITLTLSIIVLIWIARHIRIVPQSGAQNAVPNQPVEVLPSATPAPPPTQKLRKEWDERLTNAFALAIATKNFSDAACQDAARSALEEIIEKREVIERDEAERILKSKERELDYARVAEYGAITSDYDAEIIVQILRDADAWPYHVLLEAQLQIEWRSAS